jgi:phage repressor protein C with HTH and peptisase S24 domain
MRDYDRPLTHEWIWAAIDTLAARAGLSPSALARLAGLDSTTFNRSKRFTSEGRPRWPSTESIAKVLEATRTSLDEFAALDLGDAMGLLLDENAACRVDRVPIVGEIRNAAVTGWEPPAPDPAVATGREPSPPSRRHFALAVADASLEPVYSRGNTIVVSEAAEARPGDRVMVKPIGKETQPRILVRACASLVELGDIGRCHATHSVRRRDIGWMARIVLVRQ